MNFFAFAKERHNIYLRRKSGRPAPWTDDPILQQFSFTNVFRELDATTAWFRQYVREPWRDSPDVMLATVLFRWFNRINVGEAVFCQMHFDGSKTAWERRGKLQTSNEMYGWCAELKATIRAHCGAGPYVNGAYIIKGTDGMDKLTGVLDAFNKFMLSPKRTDIVPCKVLSHWRQVANVMLELRDKDPVSLEKTWDWLRRFDYLGPFMAYEIVTDLRHTALLDKAPDIMTWANTGPGAERGLARIHGRFKLKREGSSKLALSARIPQSEMILEMQDLLQQSQDPRNWPATWPEWEMREVEHTLCEFDKYERTRLGQGRPKRLFRSAA